MAHNVSRDGAPVIGMDNSSSRKRMQAGRDPVLVRLKECIRPYYLRWLYFRLSAKGRPRQFDTCWRYPFERVTPATRLPPASPDYPTLLFYPMTDWHTRFQRTQHLVSAFGRMGYRCIYLNPHLGRQFETVPLLDRAARLARLGENIMELHVRLPREPVFHHRLLRPDETGRLVSVLTSLLRTAGKGEVIQVLSLPIWFDAARQLRTTHGYPVVYDCHDYLPGFTNMAPAILGAEFDLIRGSDLVLFSSDNLRERHVTPATGRSLVVRNGVDLEHFQPLNDPAALPPVVGYVGALENWFDIEAVYESARRHPDCRFVLAGRIENPAIARLCELPNIVMKGEVPYEQLPGLMRQFRIGLIPFLVNDLTRATNPIKIYEYFSCALPVVSAPLPEVQSMGDLVYLASTPSGFAAQIRAALDERDPARRAKRIAVAQGASWASRAAQIAAEFRQIAVG
ncbi:MAG: glycosyltransferase [Bryobacterales bacterium]|nr:glycosyltransferase [Bryobacterales bacterium]